MWPAYTMDPRLELGILGLEIPKMAPFWADLTGNNLTPPENQEVIWLSGFPLVQVPDSLRFLSTAVSADTV